MRRQVWHRVSYRFNCSKNALEPNSIFTSLYYNGHRRIRREVISMMLGRFAMDWGALWMVILWALPVIGIVASVAALPKKRVQG